MNRQEVITEISKGTNLSREIVSEVMAAYEKVIINAMQNGKSVLLHKFMKIERKTKKAYMGHSFGSNDQKVIPAHDYVKIRPGSALVECIENG